jgi:hypothetical protein
MSPTKRLRTLAVGVSLGLAMLGTSTSVMADTWQVTAINDTGAAVNDIELTIGGTGGGITGPIAVNPFPANFTAPPPGNELDANWLPILFPGQAFVADFNLTTGLTPSLIGGTWTVDSAPISFVNPFLTTFADIRVPEPSTMVLACLATAGLAVMAMRKRGCAA